MDNARKHSGDSYGHNYTDSTDYTSHNSNYDDVQAMSRFSGILITIGVITAFALIIVLAAAILVPLTGGPIGLPYAIVMLSAFGLTCATSALAVATALFFKSNTDKADAQDEAERLERIKSRTTILT